MERTETTVQEHVRHAYHVGPVRTSRYCEIVVFVL